MTTQVLVLFANGPYVAVRTMDTAAVGNWGEFSEMTTAVVRSVIFAADDDEAAA